jgi:hypothetical protein
MRTQTSQNLPVQFIDSYIGLLWAAYNSFLESIFSYQCNTIPGKVHATAIKIKFFILTAPIETSVSQKSHLSYSSKQRSGTDFIP